MNLIAWGKKVKKNYQKTSAKNFQAWVPKLGLLNFYSSL